jgi:hypothetical protein
LNLGAALVVTVQHHDLRAFFEETGCRGRANSAGASGDQNAFTLKSAHVALRKQRRIQGETLKGKSV